MRRLPPYISRHPAIAVVPAILVLLGLWWVGMHYFDEILNDLISNSVAKKHAIIDGVVAGLYFFILPVAVPLSVYFWGPSGIRGMITGALIVLLITASTIVIGMTKPYYTATERAYYKEFPRKSHGLMRNNPHLR